MWGEKRLVPSVLPLLTQQYLGDGSQKDSPSPPPPPPPSPPLSLLGILNGGQFMLPAFSLMPHLVASLFRPLFLA